MLVLELLHHVCRNCFNIILKYFVNWKKMSSSTNHFTGYHNLQFTDMNARGAVPSVQTRGCFTHTATMSVSALNIRKPYFLKWALNLSRSPNAFFPRSYVHSTVLLDSWIWDCTDQTFLPEVATWQRLLTSFVLLPCLWIKGSDREIV